MAKFNPDQALPFLTASCKAAWIDVFTAVLEPGETDWRKAHGYAYVGSRYTWESNAVRLLVEEGKLKVGDPVISYRRGTSDDTKTKKKLATAGTGRVRGAYILPPGWELPENAVEAA